MKSTCLKTVSHRDGITLVELLVVVAILMLLTVVSVPVMKTSIDTGRIREASRQLNAFVAMTKARATQTGRPTGIMLQRSQPGSNAVFEIFMAEEAEPYSGDFVTVGSSAFGTAVVVQTDGGSGTLPTDFPKIFSVAFPQGSDLLVNTDYLVKPGETCLIRFNETGPRYKCFRTNNGFRIAVAGSASGRDLFQNYASYVGRHDTKVPPFSAVPASPEFFSYEIFRKPTKNSTRPLQLASGAVIDLGASGMGLDFNDDYFPAIRARGLEFAALGQLDDQPVVVMFHPGGSVDTVHYGSDLFVQPVGSIHFLLGRAEGVVESAEGTASQPNPMNWSRDQSVATPITYNKNVTDLANFWISIGHRTGSLTTSPNAWEIVTTPPYFVDSMRAARQFAQSAQTLGGR